MSEEQYQIAYLEKQVVDGEEITYLRLSREFPLSDVWDEHQNVLDEPAEDLLVLGVIGAETKRVTDFRGLPNRFKDLME